MQNENKPTIMCTHIRDTHLCPSHLALPTMHVCVECELLNTYIIIFSWYYAIAENLYHNRRECHSWSNRDAKWTEIVIAIGSFYRWLKLDFLWHIFITDNL